MPMLVLLAAAVVCVVVSRALDSVTLGSVGLGLSVVAVLVFAIRSTVAGPRVRPVPVSEDSAAAAVEPPSPSVPQVPAGWEAVAQPKDVEVAAPSPATAAATLTVAVVPGRHRFHRPDCRLVGGHEVALLTAERATDGGWSACTVCAPEA